MPSARSERGTNGGSVWSSMGLPVSGGWACQVVSPGTLTPEPHGAQDRASRTHRSAWVMDRFCLRPEVVIEDLGYRPGANRRERFEAQPCLITGICTGTGVARGDVVGHQARE